MNTQSAKNFTRHVINLSEEQEKKLIEKRTQGVKIIELLIYGIEHFPVFSGLLSEKK